MPCCNAEWDPWLKLCQLGALQRSLGSVPQGFKADDSPTHVSPLAHQMDFLLVPVACSNFSSIPGGRGLLIHLTGSAVSAGVPEEMLTTTQKTHSDLAAECVPGPGKFIYYCPGRLHQRLHAPPR